MLWGELHSKDYIKMEKFQSNELETCPDCKGSGSSGDGLCSSCNGKGII